MIGTPDEPPAGPTGPRDSGKGSTSIGEYAGLGVQFAASILLFLYVGQWLDRKLGTAPWMLLVGVFVGAGASFYGMYRRLMAAQARDEAAAQSGHDDPHSGSGP
jgi:F0F1-type ATP synthase assembly protein I